MFFPQLSSLLPYAADQPSLLEGEIGYEQAPRRYGFENPARYGVPRDTNLGVRPQKAPKVVPKSGYSRHTELGLTTISPSN
jgi:hypothetical protein